MVDTTPQNHSPEDGPTDGADAATEVFPESPAAQSPPVQPIAAPAGTPAAPVPPVLPVASGVVPPVATPPRRSGLIIAGGIIAAVIVLGGTFGAGVLVGTAVPRPGMSAAGYQYGGHGFGQERGDASRTGPGQGRFGSHPGGPGGGTQNRGAPNGVAPNGGGPGTSAPGTGSTNG